MEENIQAEDSYHILNTEFDSGKGSVYSLVSVTKRPDNSEKHGVYEIETDASNIPQQRRAGSSPDTSKKKNVDGLIVIKMSYFTSPNRRYTDLQIVELIDLIQNITLNAAQASHMLQIPKRPPQRYCA
ncbi:hypothetical protein BDC45DRAFT_574546 [Circinella umbellata]|nr:hypothetical protein BDC45DRAFT_574546 [Circinella umbellata]